MARLPGFVITGLDPVILRRTKDGRIESGHDQFERWVK